MIKNQYKISKHNEFEILEMYIAKIKNITKPY